MSSVEHLVLLQLQEHSREDAAHLQAEAQKLKAIPGVLDVRSGKNYTERGRAYNFAVTVRLKNKTAERKYQSHPLHVHFVKNVLAELKDLDADYANPLVIDFVAEAPKAAGPGSKLGQTVSKLARVGALLIGGAGIAYGAGAGYREVIIGSAAAAGGLSMFL